MDPAETGPAAVEGRSGWGPRGCKSARLVTGSAVVSDGVAACCVAGLGVDVADGPILLVGVWEADDARGTGAVWRLRL